MTPPRPRRRRGVRSRAGSHRPRDGALQRWNEFWFARDDPYRVAAFRILLGAYLVVYLGTFAPHAALLFSNQGVYVPYLVPDYAPAPGIALALFALWWLCALALLIGFRTRLTIPLLIVLFVYHYFLALAVKHSTFERLIVIYLLALWPSRPDAVWAVSQPAAADQAYVPRFAGRLVRFQTIALYFGAGLWKAVNPLWHTGTLLRSTMQSIWATPLAFWIVRQELPEVVWTAASYSVIGGEMLIGVLLALRRTRLFGLLLGTSFHVINSVILSIPEFLVCLAPYPLFLPEAWLRRLDALVSARWRRARAPA